MQLKYFFAFLNLLFCFQCFSYEYLTSLFCPKKIKKTDEKKEIEKLKYARIKFDPYNQGLENKVAFIEGNQNDIWGITDITDPRQVALQYLWTRNRNVIQDYYKIEKRPYSKNVYYLKIDGIGYLFDRVWFEQISKEEFDAERS